MKDILTTPTGTGLKNFIASLVAGIQTKSAEMLTFETGEKKRARWNGQKIVLQAALNDIFGITSSPYIIVEPNQSLGSNKYFFRRSESQAVYFKRRSENDPVFTFRRSEGMAIDYDFKVKIPSGIFTTELERRVSAQTELYKLAGTKFIIETY